MTVIAYDGTVVATDTMMTAGYTEYNAAYRKILPVQKNGRGQIHVLAFTGVTKFGSIMFEWYMKGCKEPNPLSSEDDGSLLVFLEDSYPRKFTCNMTAGLPIVAPYAIGTGDEHAYALMVAANFSAEKAVESACAHTVGCGLPVEAFDIGARKWLKSIGDKACNYEQLNDLARKCKWIAL